MHDHVCHWVTSCVFLVYGLGLIVCILQWACMLHIYICVLQ